MKKAFKDEVRVISFFIKLFRLIHEKCLIMPEREIK
jgi:hypothetical protein